MSKKYSNGLYKTTSKKQDSISRIVFNTFCALGKRVSMGIQFYQSSGECTYDYQIEGITIFLLNIAYNGEILPLES
jgi:hypothetical protein